jgi:hypothetical protein
MVRGWFGASACLKRLFMSCPPRGEFRMQINFKLVTGAKVGVIASGDWVTVTNGVPLIIV